MVVVFKNQYKMTSYEAITMEQAFTRRPSLSFAVVRIVSPLVARGKVSTFHTDAWEQIHIAKKWFSLLYRGDDNSILKPAASLTQVN